MHQVCDCGCGLYCVAAQRFVCQECNGDLAVDLRNLACYDGILAIPTVSKPDDCWGLVEAPPRSRRVPIERGFELDPWHHFAFFKAYLDG